jgi:hypothetical protein
MRKLQGQPLLLSFGCLALKVSMPENWFDAKAGVLMEQTIVVEGNKNSFCQLWLPKLWSKTTNLSTSKCNQFGFTEPCTTFRGNQS